MAFLDGGLRTIPRSRLIIAGVALLMTTIIVTAFLLESRWGYSGRSVPEVFFKSWPADRSAADTAHDLQADIDRAHADAAASRAYIATLHGPEKAKAQKQYDAYVVAQPKPFQPKGFVAPALPIKAK